MDEKSHIGPAGPIEAPLLPLEYGNKGKSKDKPKKPILAKEEGIYLEICGEEAAKLTAPERKRLLRAATTTVYVTEDFTESAKSYQVELFEDMPLGGVKLPKGLLADYQALFPNLQVQPGTNGENLPVLRAIKAMLPLSTKPGMEHLVMDPNQEEILECIFARKAGGLIQAPMGGGKAMLVCALVFGLPTLRPVAVSGKGSRDVLQLFEWLHAFCKKNPEWEEQIILSGCGKTVGKRNTKHLEEGKGIFVCTHAGLQNLPENTQLLIMDEAHAAATPKRVAKLFLRSSIRRVYGLSGTLGLRADGGDKLLEAICGPIFTASTHEKFEATNRVAPTEIHVYNFYGQEEYLPNPADPTEEPQDGYNLQQTWVENHRGRHQFVAELALYLPQQETKVIFTPHLIHADRIRKAILHEAKKLGITFEDGAEPILIHANTNKDTRNKELYLSKEEQQIRVKLLKHGILKLVICTDFLSTGVDTNMIDHVIDASGQKALITSIQRSGRGSRPRILADGTEKINRLHIILDRTKTLLRVLGEQKILELRKYYGHMPGVKKQERRGGYYLHPAPPWNPSASTIDGMLTLPMMPSDRLAKDEN